MSLVGLVLSAYRLAYAGDPGGIEKDVGRQPRTKDALILPTIHVTGAGLKREGGAVHGYVAEQSGLGAKTSTSILEIPQSVSVITREQMDLQQTATTSQALRYTAGAAGEKYGAFGGQLDITKIRGIDADYYLDGLRIISNPGTWAPQIDPYTIERVEILRGPSSYLYGESTGGGIINQSSRKPQGVAAHEMSMQLGSFRHRFLGLDFTGPLKADKSLLYRFMATGLDEHSQIEGVKHKRFYLAPSLTWRPSEQTSWTMLATHAREPEIPNYNSLPADLLGLNGSPYPALKRRRNYRDMNFDDSSRKQDSISSIFVHKFDEGWKLTSNARYMHISSDLKRSTVYGYELTDGRPLLKNTYELSPSSSKTFSMDSYINGEVFIGRLRNSLLVGVDYATGKVMSSLYSDGPYLIYPYGQNYRPDIDPNFNASRLAPWADKQNFDRSGAYIQDQVSYGRWRLTLGARYDRSKTNNGTQSYSPVTVHSRTDDRKWTGRAGLSYQFDSGIAPYVSYATSFDPLLGSGYGGHAFVPTETKQSEVGVKFHPRDSSTLLTAAIFNLEQTNVKTADVDHLGFNTQAGKVRSRGVDLSATTELGRNVNLIANYSYLDNTLIHDASYRGNSLTQTPRQSATLWMDYLMANGALAGLKLGVGVRYLGATYGDPANTFKVPAVTLFDLALSYDLERLSPALSGSTLAFNASDISNRKYVASCTSAMYCFVGQDRFFTVTFGYRW